MIYVITDNSVSFYINNKIYNIDSNDEKYEKLCDALKENAPEYEIKYILDPKDVDDVKKILLNPLEKL